jgi:hypothetical protein
MIRLSTVHRNNKSIRTFEKYNDNGYKNNNDANLNINKVRKRQLFICGLLCCAILLYIQFQGMLLVNLIRKNDDLELDRDRYHIDIDNIPYNNEGIFTCKNTKYGSTRVCDSSGIICTHSEVNVTSNCCESSTNDNIIYSDIPNFQSYDNNIQIKYNCYGCNKSISCCNNYESCVSCCLHPYHLKQNEKYIKTLKFSPMKDLSSFDWCVYLCRSSSMSVLRSENNYRSNSYNCYFPVQPPLDNIARNSDRLESAKNEEKGYMIRGRIFSNFLRDVQ